MKRLLAFVDDRLNPIVVKELRQSVQGRFVSAVLFFFLLVQLATLTVYLLASDIDTVDVTGGEGFGGRVFGFILGFLLFASIVVLPVYVAVRLYVERAGDSLSLLFISTLPPRRIIAGKLVANQVLALLLFSACLPFVSFTYFLRGIDLPSILVVFCIGFLVVTLAIQSTILLACLPAGRFLKILLGLAGLVGLVTVFSTTFTLSAAMVTQGVGSRIATRDFLVGGAVFLGAALFLVALFFLLSVALVSPPMANRARPVRLFLCGVWLASGVATAIVASRPGGRYAPEIWLTTWTLIAVAACVVAVGARDRMSARVAHQVPRSAPRRLLAFLFYSGSANGVAWALALALATLAGGFLFDALAPHLLLVPVVERMAGLAGYGFAYTVAALLLHRRFLARRLGRSYTWVVALLLAVTGALGPLILGFLALPDEFARSGHEWRWWFLNPFAPLQPSLAAPAARFGLIVSVVVATVAAPWFLGQARAFRRPAAWVERGARDGATAASPLE